MRKKIYLSEPALVCNAGKNGKELYEACIKGERNGFVTREFNGKQYPTGRIKDEFPPVDISGLGPAAFTVNTRIFSMINAALCQMEAGVEKAIAKYGREKIGVYLGSCDNGSEASSIAHNAFLSKGEFPKDYDLRYQSASFAAEFAAAKFGITGPCLTIATACASGASAIMRGAELIRAGVCGAVIAGGADIVSDTVFAGFNALEAVSDSPTNPFSKNRKGINLGEGAAFFLLEADEISNIELLGAGESSDAYHMTAPSKDGAGPARAMKAALLDAGIESNLIGYVNLHGTGTDLNDKAESLALRTIFGENPIPVSSTKPITGHTLGAAGSLEAAICWYTINEKRGLPLHCWDGEYDEEAPFLPATASHASPLICMTNSFAFGGCNVSLILGGKK